MNDKVSVIIPIYNVEKYLDKCLNSILYQTYKNIEVILVNDGSTDNSVDICNKYVDLDNRFVLINKKNEGVAVARNTGIKYSSGKYICFVDSDDWVDNNYIESLISASENGKYEFICSSCVFEKRFKRKMNYKYENKIIDSSLLSSQYIEFFNIVLHAPWGKLYKKNIIDKFNILFPINYTIAEDSIFNLNYYEHIKNFRLIDNITYHYNNTNNSSAMKKYHKDICIFLFNVFEKKINYIKNNSLDLSLIEKERLKYFEWAINHYITHPHVDNNLFYNITKSINLFTNNKKNIICKYDKYIKNNDVIKIIKKWKKEHFLEYSIIILKNILLK